MKVILRQTLPKVGKQGQEVNVADGFARNFLFPRGLATIADKSSRARLERERAKLADEHQKTLDSATAIKGAVDGKTVRIIAKTGRASAKLFGAVTDELIVEGIQQTLGVTIDRKQVALMHPIKRLGIYDVMLDLHPQVDATIKLEVADETGWLGVEIAESLIEQTSQEQQEPAAVAESEGTDAHE
jgi:large subunit ribosomal protein L9